MKKVIIFIILFLILFGMIYSIYLFSSSSIQDESMVSISSVNDVTKVKKALEKVPKAQEPIMRKVANNLSILDTNHVIEKNTVILENQEQTLVIMDLDSMDLFNTKISTKGFSYWYQNEEEGMVCGIRNGKYIDVYREPYVEKETYEINKLDDAPHVEMLIMGVCVQDDALLVLVNEFLYYDIDELMGYPRGIRKSLVKICMSNKEQSELYNRKVSHEAGFSFGPYIIGNEIYFTDDNLLIRINDGTKDISKASLVNTISAPFLVKDQKIILTTYKDLVVLDLAAFHENWRVSYKKAGEDYVAVKPVIFNDQIIIGTTVESIMGTGIDQEDHYYISSFNLENGELNWVDIIDGELLIPPISSGDLLITVTSKWTGSEFISIISVYDTNGNRIIAPIHTDYISAIRSLNDKAFVFTNSDVYELDLFNCGVFPEK